MQIQNLEMQSQPYKEWISIYNADMKCIWDQEKVELRKISMIYCAFQKELERLKSHLSSELSTLTTALKKKHILEKCKNFKGLAESVPLNITNFNQNEKENKSPEASLQEEKTDNLNSEMFVIKHPQSHVGKETTPPPASTNIIAASPVLPSDSVKLKRKLSKIPLQPTENKAHSGTLKTNDSNIMDCSIVNDTPESTERKSKRSRLKLKSKKSHLDKTKQGTLTQLFFEPTKSKKAIDSDLPSMDITEMLNLINESSSDSDNTVDLEMPSHLKSPEQFKKPGPEIAYEEVVRGKERLKLKGWSCRECKDYYEALNLPPDELQKKMDQCSRHRSKFKPRGDSFNGFWDLSFKPSLKTQKNYGKSLVLNYKK